MNIYLENIFSIFCWLSILEIFSQKATEFQSWILQVPITLIIGCKCKFGHIIIFNLRYSIQNSWTHLIDKFHTKIEQLNADKMSTKPHLYPWRKAHKSDWDWVWEIKVTKIYESNLKINNLKPHMISQLMYCIHESHVCIHKSSQTDKCKSI